MQASLVAFLWQESFWNAFVRMNEEACRLGTFYDWPFYASKRPFILAENGFYYTGAADCVRCFSCGVEIRDWRLEDGVRERHRVASPACEFLSGNDTRLTRNVPMIEVPPELAADDLLEEIRALGGPVRSQEHPRQRDLPRSGRALDSGCNPQRADESISTTLGIVTDEPNHWEFIRPKTRLATFKTWPKSSTVCPESLAAAGFYYVGFQDRVQCFFCGGGLRNWAQHDDPWRMHIQHLSHCGYIRLKKGENYVTSVLHESMRASAVHNRQDPASEEIPAVGTVLEGPSMESHGAHSRRGHTSQILIRIRYCKMWNQPKKEKLFTTCIEAYKHFGISHIGHRKQRQCGQTTAVNGQSSSRVETVWETAQGVRDLQQEVESLQRRYICPICTDEERMIVFLPCGHLICCADCSVSMQKCPVCRATITGRVRVNSNCH